MPTAAEALPGRPQSLPVADKHFVNGNRLAPPFPEGLEPALFGMGCFWGAERLFWELPGVWSTSGRLRGRHHAEPDLPGSLFRQHGPYGSRSRRVRP
jgi:peptide-methionine (S)-S-oxide reductase